MTALLSIQSGGACQLMPRDLSVTWIPPSPWSTLAVTRCHLLVGSRPQPPAEPSQALGMRGGPGPAGPSHPALCSFTASSGEGLAGWACLSGPACSPRFSSATGTGPVCMAGDVASAPVPCSGGDTIVQLAVNSFISAHTSDIISGSICS